MSAYWRSPYREPTNSFRHPNHSTLKFEQSLYLSRSRSSIHSPRYDWLDIALNSPDNNNNNNNNDDGKPNQKNLVRSNTNIKSILKTPRDHCSIHGKDTYNETPEKPTPVDKQQQVSKKDKKKVTFGLNENVEVENDGTKSSIYLRNKKFQLATMNRISHSRFLEESALEKLNRLMGVSAQSTSLPSVTGKGLLSPRPNTSKPSKYACNHNSDLKCKRCSHKDTDTENEKSNTDINQVQKYNRTLQSKKDKPMKDLPVLFPDPWGENEGENVMNNHVVDESYLSNPEEVQNSLPDSGFDNAKKHSRLLPGRYPFNTGAMQIQKLMISDGQKGHNSNHNGAVSMEETNVIDLQNGRVDTGNRVCNLDENHEPPQIKTPNTNGANESGRASTAHRRTPTILPSSILHIEPATIVTEKGPNKQNSLDTFETECKKHKSSKETTSRILDWLNDVNKKQTFTPGLVLESR